MIAICLATCEPDPARLEAQLASIETQTRRDWLCIVADDASSPARLDWLARRVNRGGRYRLLRGERRVGFYRNFERALAAVGDARFVALCDQDDRWHPEKLARSVAALESSGKALVVSARRIVDEQGPIAIAPAPRVRDLGLLLLENTVAGAASLFRRELLDRALPFPDADAAFHDHWLACVAMLDGGIATVDEPLVDYVQHAGNVIGHRARASGALLRALRLAANPRRWRRAIAEARSCCARELPRLERFAAELERRFPGARLRLDVAGLLALEARALYAGEAAGIAGQLALGRLAARIASSQA